MGMKKHIHPPVPLSWLCHIIIIQTFEKRKLSLFSVPFTAYWASKRYQPALTHVVMSYIESLNKTIRCHSFSVAQVQLMALVHSHGIKKWRRVMLKACLCLCPTTTTCWDCDVGQDSHLQTIIATLYGLMRFK